MQNLLYRGVSVVEDEKNNGEIILKGKVTAIEGQCGDPWMECGEEIESGRSDRNAVAAHQSEWDKPNTAYVSTSKKIEVAIRFATTGNLQDGYVYTLDAKKFSEYGVIAYERQVGGVTDEHEAEVTIRTEDLSPIPGGVVVNKKLVKPV